MLFKGIALGYGVNQQSDESVVIVSKKTTCIDVDESKLW